MSSSDIISILGIILTLLPWFFPNISRTAKVIISIIVASICVAVVVIAPNNDDSGSDDSSSSKTKNQETIITSTEAVSETAPVVFSTYTGSMSQLNRLSFYSAEASSELNDPTYGSFPAKDAIDGDDTSSWQEGVSGVGVGEYLKLYFNREQSVSVLAVNIGHVGNNDQAYTFSANSRPKTLLFCFSDGSSASYTFRDTHDTQTILLSHPVTTSYVIVEIREAYDAQWQDTAISEIKAFSLS